MSAPDVEVGNCSSYVCFAAQLVRMSRGPATRAALYSLAFTLTNFITDRARSEALPMVGRTFGTAAELCIGLWFECHGSASRRLFLKIGSFTLASTARCSNASGLR